MSEELINIPNTLTAYRVLITIFIIFAAIFKLGLLTIIVAFVIGMLTDFFDGQAARRLKQETEFGRKFDMIADRILMIVTVCALLFMFRHVFSYTTVFEILLVMSREIISAPFAFYYHFIKGRGIPKAKFIGKVTTFMQGVSFPLIFLGLRFNSRLGLYFSILTGIIGMLSAVIHIKGLRKE